MNKVWHVRPHLQAQDADENLIDNRANGVPGQQGSDGIDGVPEGVGNEVEASVPAHITARIEGLESKLLIVEQPLGLCCFDRVSNRVRLYHRAGLQPVKGFERNEVEALRVR